MVILQRMRLSALLFVLILSYELSMEAFGKDSPCAKAPRVSKLSHTSKYLSLVFKNLINFGCSLPAFLWPPLFYFFLWRGLPFFVVQLTCCLEASALVDSRKVI